MKGRGRVQRQDRERTWGSRQGRPRLLSVAALRLASDVGRLVLTHLRLASRRRATRFALGRPDPERFPARWLLKPTPWLRAGATPLVHHRPGQANGFRDLVGTIGGVDHRSAQFARVAGAEKPADRSASPVTTRCWSHPTAACPGNKKPARTAASPPDVPGAVERIKTPHHVWQGVSNLALLVTACGGACRSS